MYIYVYICTILYIYTFLYTVHIQWLYVYMYQCIKVIRHGTDERSVSASPQARLWYRLIQLKQNFGVKARVRGTVQRGC